MLGKIDLLITGASLITLDGIRWGKGHGYFDLEWAILRELQLADETTPIVAVVHDCQIVDMAVTPDVHDTIVDYIVTPTKIISIDRRLPKPKGIMWDALDPAIKDQIPPLKELHERRGRCQL